MPISREEFEKGRTRDAIKTRIEKLLEDGQAYTLSEIGTHLFGKPRNFWEGFILGLTDTLIIKQALEELIREGIVEAREVETRYGEETYFALKRRVTRNK